MKKKPKTKDMPSKKTLKIVYTEGTEFFFDEKNELITAIHENDANWRSEYMNCIVEHFGVQIVQIDTEKFPKDIQDKLQEMYDDYAEADDVAEVIQKGLNSKK